MHRRAWQAIAIGALVCLGLAGCEKKKQDKNNPDWLKQAGRASCKTDEACAKGFICGDDGTCVKGKRSAAELAKKAAAKQAKLKAAADAKKVTKKGEGRLTVRICPYFKNTMEAMGTIIATHQETKKKHYLHLARIVKELDYQDEFTFWSLPLGKYDVAAQYGIQVKGQPDVHLIPCYVMGKEKAEPCRDGTIREMEVVLPKDLPPPVITDAGVPKKKPCDWLAE